LIIIIFDNICVVLNNYFPTRIVCRRSHGRQHGQAVDARRGLRSAAQLGRGTRPVVRGRGRVPGGHLGPGGGAGRRCGCVRDRVARQRSVDLGAQRPRRHLRVVPSDGRLYGTE